MRNLVIGWIVLFTMAGTAFSETKEPPKELAVDLGGGVKLTMVLIPAGEFLMGSGESAEETAAFFNRKYGEDPVQADRFKEEHPQHRVRITKPFYLALPCDAGPVPAVRRGHSVQDGRGERQRGSGLEP